MARTKERTGKFLSEITSPRGITLEAFRGVYDPSLSTDCRCGRECAKCEFSNFCDLKPWAALSSPKNWGDEILTPDGLADGDRPHRDFEFIPIEELLASDFDGTRFLLFDGEPNDEELSEDEGKTELSPSELQKEFILMEQAWLRGESN